MTPLRSVCRCASSARRWPLASRRLISSMLASRTQLPQPLGQSCTPGGGAASTWWRGQARGRRRAARRSETRPIAGWSRRRAAARARSAYGSTPGSATGRWWSCRPPAAAPRGRRRRGTARCATPTRSSSSICSARSMRRPMAQETPAVAARRVLGQQARERRQHDHHVVQRGQRRHDSGGRGSCGGVREQVVELLQHAPGVRRQALLHLPAQSPHLASGCRRCSRRVLGVEHHVREQALQVPPLPRHGGVPVLGWQQVEAAEEVQDGVDRRVAGPAPTRRRGPAAARGTSRALASSRSAYRPKPEQVVGHAARQLGGADVGQPAASG